MSLSKSATIRRRLSLLAGSSLVAAGLTAAASFGVALAPTAAFAANECTPVGVDPSANPGQDTYVCSEAAYPTGITYTSDGDLTVTTDAPVNPDLEEPLTEVGVEGVNLIGQGSDSVVWDSISGIVSGQGGAIIDVSTQSGDVAIRASRVFDTVGGGVVSHAVRAASSGGGSVDVEVDFAGEFSGNPDGIGIEAISTGGDGDVNVTASSVFAATGIVAQTSGSGALTVTNESGGISSDLVGIDAIAGTGLLTINVDNSSVFSGGTAIRTSSGGDTVVNLGAASISSFSGWAWDMTIANGGVATLNMAENSSIGRIRASGSGSMTISMAGSMSGGSDFSGLTGGVDLDILESGAWRVQPSVSTAVQFSSGNDAVTSAGLVVLGSRQDPILPSQTLILDFGDGSDAFTNAGVILVQPSSAANQQTQQDFMFKDFAAETRLVGLETFTHSGVILLGTRSRENVVLGTDRWYDDVLSLPGTHWIGDGGEIIFDVDLNRTQSDCTTRNAERDLGAADCLMIVGGSTEGITYATINEIVRGDRGRYDPDGIVLVDLTGGASHQGDFVVSSSTPGYSPEFGGSLNKGVFHYVIAWDEAKQQQKLVGLPGAASNQLPLLASAGQNLWRTSTGTWFERQADQRGLFEDGVGSGFWLRASTEKVDRDVLQGVSAFGQTFTFDNTLQQTSLAVTGGADLIVGGDADSAWVLGLMAGYATAEIEYEASVNQARFEGWTGGAYASYVSGGFFIDAAINANKIDLEDTVPSLNLFPEGTILSTQVLSWGVQLESGLRFPLGGGLFVEPLVGLSWVQTQYDDMEIPADDPTRPRIGVEFDDPASFRGSLGGRLGWDQDYGSFRTQLSLLGKMVEEFDGENVVILHNPGPDAELVDDFSGRFTEFGVGASVYSASGTVSGFVNFGGKFGDDYEAKTGSIGVRVNW